MINNELKDLLISLKDNDIELRQKILRNGSLYDGYDKELEALHLNNAEKLFEIVSEYGWPGKSLVGKEGLYAACLLAQHSISNPKLQKVLVNYLRTAVEKEEATPLQLACLEDRILFNEGRPQKYGLLFDWTEKGELFTNVDDENLVNERRKKLGLKTITEATELHRREIVKEGGGPPSDYHEHKRQEIAWAERVGWR